MSESVVVRLVSAALDDEEGDPVLRGVIDPQTLDALRVDSYQREILPAPKIRLLAEALAAKNAVPDIELGMRGGNFRETGRAFELLDPVYIVDGLQRSTAAKQVFASGGSPRLGAVVRFNTSEQIERERFDKLNNSQTRVSANVLLRNQRHHSPAVQLLYTLCQDSRFVLYDRVSWCHNLQRNHLITAITLVKAAAMLHCFKVTGLAGGQLTRLVPTLDAFLTIYPRNAFRDNISTYWTVMDECFHVRDVHFAERAPFLKNNFVITLARVFAEYENFWSDTVLAVEKDLRRKLQAFPVTDPSIMPLCSGNSASMRLLHTHIVDYLNSGKRTRRLQSFTTEGTPHTRKAMAAARQ